MRVCVFCLVHVQLNCLTVHLGYEPLVTVFFFEGILG